MATDQDIGSLDALTGAQVSVSNDLIPIVDASDTAAGKTKQISVNELFQSPTTIAASTSVLTPLVDAGAAALELRGHTTGHLKSISAGVWRIGTNGGSADAALEINSSGGAVTPEIKWLVDGVPACAILQLGGRFFYDAGTAGHLFRQRSDGSQQFEIIPVAGATKHVSIQGGNAVAPLVNIPHGTTLASPADGDVWTTTSGMFVRVNGTTVGPLVAASGITLGTEQASTSGTSIDFTGIPAGTKRITIMFNGVSLSGTDNILIQLGDAGGFEATGYLGAGGTTTGAGAATANFTTGFGITTDAATNIIHGAITLHLEDASDFTWVASGGVGYSDVTKTSTTYGSKSLSQELSQVRITTLAGANTYDAGVINVAYG